MDKRLAGKNVLITGASRGFGKQIAMALWKEGANLLLVSRTRTAWTEPREGGQMALVMTADLSDPEGPRRMVAEARRRWPKLDVLVNNAGAGGPIGPFCENDAEQWQYTMLVNFFAPLELCRLVIPWMRQTGGGSIINISGGGAAAPRPHFSAYAASKAALAHFTETLAEEVAPYKIRVNSVSPGGLHTEINQAIIDAGPKLAGEMEYQRALAHQESGGTSPEHAGSLCVFLASPESEGISGRLIHAIRDPWRELKHHKDEMRGTDIYTLRRITPAERGKSWE